MVITTSRHASEAELTTARDMARRLGLPFVPRDGSLAALSADVALVVTKERLVLHTAAGQLFFHPGMARPRLRTLERGQTDVMVEAMGLQPGDDVLDCTLGLGSDAIVAAHVVGDGGTVVGLEAVAVLAEVVRVGMATYDPEHDATEDAMRRIQVTHADHAEYLPGLPDDCFDIVYFDPLFRDPVEQSVHMQPWRYLGADKPLTRAVIDEALRIARRRVVVKERRDSPVFAELGISRITGGRRSRVAYGIIETDGQERSS